jgi:hypothetical protein
MQCPKLRVRYARSEVEHVAAAGWAEIFLLRLDLAVAVDLDVGVIPTKPVLADGIAAGQKVRDRNPGVITALATY